MSHYRWVDRHGDWWEFAPPATVSEVLEIEAYQMHDLKADILEEGVIRPVAVAPLLHELVRRTVSCSVPGWDQMDHDERFDALDTSCDVSWRLDYWRAMVDAVSLPEETLEAVGKYLDLEFGGGCECPVCKGDRPEDDRSVVYCLRAEVPLHVSQIVGLYFPVKDEPILDKPWWMHQVRSAFLAAEGRARTARREELEERRQDAAEKARIDGKLRQLGGRI